jgi:hypothetical protein
MAKGAREEPAPEEVAQEFEIAEEPDVEMVIFFDRPGTTEPTYDAIVGPEEEKIITAALRRCGGVGAVLDHLAAIGVRDVLRLKPECYTIRIRDQDVGVIAEALKIKPSKKALPYLRKALTYLVAGAIIHALAVRETDLLRTRRDIYRDDNQRRRKGLRQGPQAHRLKAEEWRGIARDLWNAGETDPEKIKRVLANEHGISKSIGAIRNYLTKLRRY